MDTLAQLEEVVEGLMERLHSLEEENGRLRGELERETDARAAVQARVEHLLSKVREKLG